MKPKSTPVMSWTTNFMETNLVSSCMMFGIRIRNRLVLRVG